MEKPMSTKLYDQCGLLLFVAAAAVGSAVAVEDANVTQRSVWPLPVLMSTSGSPMRLSKDFKIVNLHDTSDRLNRAIERYTHWIHPSEQSSLPGSSNDLTVLEVNVTSDSEVLNASTRYGYHIAVADGRAVIDADTVYGAIYGLETLSQLVTDGVLGYGELSVHDYPRYRHRGFMLDSGRRFFPVPLVNELLDAMSYLKLNVLHLHLSDFCRFAVESLLYPQLTAHSDGFYTQQEVKDLVAYAQDRGVRVVPEFDFPGHSRGLLPLESSGDVVFCSDAKAQLRNDEQGHTADTLKKLITEMSALFNDQLFHIGCDETVVSAECPLSSTRKLEQVLQEHVHSLGKTPVGWEEILFASQAAENGTVVNTWQRQSASQATHLSYQAVASSEPDFYLNYVSTTYDKAWTDIGFNVSARHMDLLLGGEFSMWSDNYCYIRQCHLTGPKPVAWWMYQRAEDKAFRDSIMAMVWPRGIVAAGSFWNYQAGIDAHSPQFLAMYHRQTERLVARGIASCPAHCHCDEVSQCGKPYPHAMES